MFTQKLLANADRGMDKSSSSRDIIDIAMMIDHWGAPPVEAMLKAQNAYGNAVVRGFENSINLIQDKVYFGQCLAKMKMDEKLLEKIQTILKNTTLDQDCAAAPDVDRAGPSG